jgi:hypothetical protein
MLAESWSSTWHVAIRFTLSALAVYRVSFLVAREDGPWGLFRQVRSAAKGTVAGRLVTCLNCLSIWIALPLAWFVGSSWVERVVAWWALSGAAVLMDRATRDPFEIETKEPTL